MGGDDEKTNGKKNCELRMFKPSISRCAPCILVPRCPVTCFLCRQLASPGRMQEDPGSNPGGHAAMMEFLNIYFVKIAKFFLC